jgi:hypothetical protein
VRLTITEVSNEEFQKLITEGGHAGAFAAEMPGGERVVTVAEFKQAQTRIAELEAESERRRRLLEISDERVNRLSEEVERLEKQLAEANARAEAYNTEIGRLCACNARNCIDRDAAIERAEQAEARAADLAKALGQVKAYLSSEEGPLYALWENGDICSWDDNPREKWEHVLEDLGDLENFQMTELDIGMGVKWEAVTVYRTVQAALNPDARQEGDKE